MALLLILLFQLNWPCSNLLAALHFHLAVPKASADFDNTEFQYLPLLDANRDRDLVNMLPDFLTVDITFKRGQAAKFYTRVIDALTKRRSLAA